MTHESETLRYQTLRAATGCDHKHLRKNKTSTLTSTDLRVVRDTQPFFKQSLLDGSSLAAYHDTMARIRRTMADHFETKGEKALTDLWACPDEVKYYLRDLRTTIMDEDEDADWPWASVDPSLKYGLVYQTGLESMIRYVEEQEKASV